MTQEQNKPVRTQADSIADICNFARCYGDMTTSQRQMIATGITLGIEARGAAEQRRKDAEGQDPIAWVIPDHLPSETYPHCELVLYRRKASHNTLPLYTHPANVAALEARVKELEDNLKHAEKWAEVAHTSCMGTGPKQALGETLYGLHQFLVAALNREGGA